MKPLPTGNYKIPLLLLIVLSLIPVFIKSPYILSIAITVLLYAFSGNAWNIAGGYCGQLSLGHAAYFGLGAYTSTMLFLKFGVSPWGGMIVGAVIVGVVAAILGYPSLRLKGPYFIFFTIAFAEAIRIFFLAWDWVEGARGIIIPFQDSLVNFMSLSKVFYYYVALGFLIIGMLVTYLIANSKMGKYFIAIREDEMAAEALGINTALYKTYAFAISAALVAIGGAFYAQYNLYIDPDCTMVLSNSVLYMLVAVVGGRGTLFGPLIGSVIIMPLWERSRAMFGGQFAGLSLIIAGLIIVVVGLAAPNGLMGILSRIRTRYLKSKVSIIEEEKRV
ncbi:MAG: branched-chain amino acid ABC transporter permease [Dehalococcoidia bacterium]|nr:branched-chain amino acid ABC transporter permease [Dehalococcoidia bacterium]MDH5781934.1 branched-chain amino acid ABC transporter permease [Dehalococcoidia bacterium]